jgi:hypothetical protein
MLTSAGRALLPQVLLERGLDVVRSDVERPTLSDTTRHRVRAYLQDDTDRLRALTGMAFDSWSL